MAFTEMDGSFEVWTRERILRSFVFNRVRTEYRMVYWDPASSWISGLRHPNLAGFSLDLYPDYYSFRGHFLNHRAMILEEMRRINERVGLVAPP
ncbi:hypothetical protein CAEBREN_02691 [Caenorhabditis brenneri]|uniref:Uncharacterized protein n=1 Tax=Caenorhabditis brenneri TaxID=135651 RepID=G0NW53_CAEBE|nr:hypothetical protein CAEBREN_02691 [Caenorhabditis brenneri]